MMIRNRDDAGAELDPMGDHRGRRQHHFWRCDGFPSSRMMLANPELIVAEVIEERGELQIALELQGRVFAGRMMRREKHAKAHSIFHGGSLLISRSTNFLLQPHRWVQTTHS